MRRKAIDERPLLRANDIRMLCATAADLAQKGSGAGDRVALRG